MTATTAATVDSKAICVRHVGRRRATTDEYLTVGSTTYKIPLCDEHANMMQAQLFAWTRLGEPVNPEDRPVLRPVADHEQSRRPSWHRPKPVERVHVPVAKVVAEPTEPDLPAWMDQLPAEVRDTLRHLPKEDLDWALSNLARNNADKYNIELFTVLLAAADPSEARESANDPNIWLHTRGNITAVVCPSNRTVLTVHRNNREVSSRGHRAS